MEIEKEIETLKVEIGSLQGQLQQNEQQKQMLLQLLLKAQGGLETLQKLSDD